MSEIKCPGCGRAMGTDVQPGKYCMSARHRKLNVAQLCVDCTATLLSLHPRLESMLDNNPEQLHANFLSMKKDSLAPNPKLTFAGDDRVAPVPPSLEEIERFGVPVGCEAPSLIAP